MICSLHVQYLSFKFRKSFRYCYQHFIARYKTRST